MVIAHDAKEAVRIEVVRILDALFLEIAENQQEEEGQRDEFVEQLWGLYERGELKLVNGIAPVEDQEQWPESAAANRPIVKARQAVLAASSENYDTREEKHMDLPSRIEDWGS
jgi:outer membrane protein TolC